MHCFAEQVSLQVLGSPSSQLAPSLGVQTMTALLGSQDKHGLLGLAVPLSTQPVPTIQQKLVVSKMLSHPVLESHTSMVHT